MEAATLALLFAGGLLSGAITPIAGGGSFLTFPMLLAAGLPPMAANITNWVALMPGNFMALAAYRSELAEMRHDVRPHLLMAFGGGLSGSLLLLWAGEVRFEKAVPWLIWRYAVPILIASGLGGYGAVFPVRRVPQHVLRLAVLTSWWNASQTRSRVWRHFLVRRPHWRACSAVASIWLTARNAVRCL